VLATNIISCDKNTAATVAGSDEAASAKFAHYESVNIETIVLIKVTDVIKTNEELINN
jgi:hypothetical protein